MSDIDSLQQFTKQCVASLEAIAKDSKKAIGDHLKHSLSKKANQSGFVTREEFDIQTKVLAKTRAKLETLEQLLEKLLKSSHSC